MSANRMTLLPRAIAAAIALVLAATLALALSAAPAGAGVQASGATGPGATASQDSGTREGEATRADFIRTAEPICARDTRRNVRILKGVRKQVREGKLAPAGRRFTRATRAFTQTLRAVLDIPRPAEDRQLLNRWIKYLIKQRSYLAQISKALGNGDGYQAQRLSLLLIRNANQANQSVRGYGFRHCLIRPNKFL